MGVATDEGVDGPLWCDCSRPFTPALNGPDKRFDGHFHRKCPLKEKKRKKKYSTYMLIGFCGKKKRDYWTFADFAHSSVACYDIVQPGLTEIRLLVLSFNSTHSFISTTHPTKCSQVHSHCWVH